MDVNILVEQTIANWQLYHSVAVGIGSFVCAVVGAILVYWLIARMFSELSKKL